MRVLIEQAPVPRFPVPAGAFELVWASILDEIFADAWEANLEELKVVLPGESLAEAARLRAGMTPDREGSAGRGIAMLAPGMWPDSGAVRTYRCEGGLFALRPLRARSRGPDGATCIRSIPILTWRARAWGLLMRLGTVLRMPVLVDRAAAAARRSFAGGWGPSYCRLSVWTR